MKKKSQQTLKHKPPNIFNLVTKVMVSLVFLVSIISTGILNGTGIEIVKPVHASTKYDLTVQVETSYMGSACSGCGSPYTPYYTTGSTIKFTYDTSNNSFSTNGSKIRFSDYSSPNIQLYGKAGVDNNKQWLNANQVITLTPSEMSVITSMGVGSNFAFEKFHADTMQGGYSPGSVENVWGKIISKTPVSSGGSCGSTSTTKYELTVQSESSYMGSACSGCGSMYTPYYTPGSTIKFTYDTSNNSFFTNGSKIMYSYNSSPNIQLYGKTGIDPNKQWLNANQVITLTPSEMSQVSSSMVGGSYSFEKFHADTMQGGYSPASVEYVWGKVISKSPVSTSSGSCGGTTSPPPTTTTVYPRTCASGLTPKGTPGTSSFYCEKPVKQTEIKNPDFIKDINLGDIIAGMGDYGSTGDRGDGQFNLDSGNHNNGWYLNGNGDAYKSDHIQFTNVPDNGYVNALGDKWSPEYLITQGKNKIDVPLPTDATTVEKQKRGTSLNNFKTTGSLSEVITYKVSDLESLKTIQGTDKGLIDLFSKTGSNYKYGSDIVSHKVDSMGEGSYGDFKVNQSGYYILGTKYIDMVGAKKESATPSQDIIDKHTYYSFVPVSINFMSDLGYLPVYNNLLTQINDSLLTVGNKKANHKLSNLEYQTYKSMKVPSAYNYSNDKTLVGSTSGGLQLLSKDLSPINVTDNSSTMDSAKITDIVEYGSGFYVSTDKGILYLNCEDNTLNKTSVTDAVNDLELYHDSLYYITDTRLSVLFADGANLIKSSNEYDLTTMFSGPTIKAGRVEVLNGLLTISSKDDSTASEVITLTK